MKTPAWEGKSVTSDSVWKIYLVLASAITQTECVVGNIVEQYDKSSVGRNQ